MEHLAYMCVLRNCNADATSLERRTVLALIITQSTDNT